MNNSRKLTLIGTGLFLLSFLLPAYGDSSGFRCAWFCAVIIQEGFDWSSAFYFAFSFLNLLMLTLPFLVFVHYRDRPFPKKVIGLQVLCLLYALSWWFINLNTLEEIRIGCYVWIGSMALLLRATWATRKQRGSIEINPETAQSPV